VIIYIYIFTAKANNIKSTLNISESHKLCLITKSSMYKATHGFGLGFLLVFFFKFNSPLIMK
jgi:hypothetical protein